MGLLLHRSFLQGWSRLETWGDSVSSTCGMATNAMLGKTLTFQGDTVVSSSMRALMLTLIACLSSLSWAVAIPGQGTWEYTLKPRDLNSDGIVDAYYDTALNITWSDVPLGKASWPSHNGNALLNKLGGVSGWRLPIAVDTGLAGCDFSFGGGTDCGYNISPQESELAHLFHITFGNQSLCKPGLTVCAYRDQVRVNTGNFKFIESGFYWTSGIQRDNKYFAYAYNMEGGAQIVEHIVNAEKAIMVHSGDVAAIPEPAGKFLLPIGLAFLLLVFNFKESKR